MLDNVNIYFIGSFPSIAGISPARVGISPSSPDAIENYHHAHKGAKTLRKNSPQGSPDAIENYHQVRKNAANKKQTEIKKPRFLGAKPTRVLTCNAYRCVVVASFVFPKRFVSADLALLFSGNPVADLGHFNSLFF